MEVLDPEQNTAFHDNYLDIDYDLSKVLFIATANNISTIPSALRDRMELIEVTGYIAEEKLKIAEQHLVPKEAKEHGLKVEDIHFAPGALDLIIEEYTRESGVRSLTKQIAAVMRSSLGLPLPRSNSPRPSPPSSYVSTSARPSIRAISIRATSTLVSSLVWLGPASVGRSSSSRAASSQGSRVSSSSPVASVM